MKKAFKYILITTLFLFVGYSGVEAKTGDFSCKYRTDDNDYGIIYELSAEYDEKTMKIKNWQNGTIKCSMYNGKSCYHTSIEDTNIYSDKNLFMNSDSKFECPQYAIFYEEEQKSLTQNILDFYSLIAPNLHTKIAAKVASKFADSSYIYEFFISKNKGKWYGPDYYNTYDEDESPTETSTTVTDVINYRLEKDSSYKLMKLYATGTDDDYKTGNPGKSEKNFSCNNQSSTINILKDIYSLVRYLVPVIIIVLSIVDFIKSVASGDDKEFKEVWGRFVKRLIVGIIILILPAILQLVISLSGALNSTNGDNIFCIFG